MRNYKVSNYKHGLRRTKLYKVWDCIKQRCLNKNCKAYKRYGGRGITICNEWIHSPEVFMSWARLNGYSERLQIDRIDNNKGYYPGNCRFVTSAENMRNQSKTKMCLESVTQVRELYSTGKYRQIDLAKKYNIHRVTISNIVNHKTWKV